MAIFASKPKGLRGSVPPEMLAPRDQQGWRTELALVASLMIHDLGQVTL